MSFNFGLNHLSKHWELSSLTNGSNTNAKRSNYSLPFSGSIKSTSNSQRDDENNGGNQYKLDYPSPAVSPEVERSVDEGRLKDDRNESIKLREIEDDVRRFCENTLSHEMLGKATSSSTTTTTTDDLFLTLDPALFSTSYNSLPLYQPQNRILSNASIIDYNSPPFSNLPTFDSNLPPVDSTSLGPHKLMSKEEWLKLGGYGNADEVVPDIIVDRPSSINSINSFGSLFQPLSPTLSNLTNSRPRRISNFNNIINSQNTTRKVPLSSSSSNFSLRQDLYIVPTSQFSTNLQSQSASNSINFSFKPSIPLIAEVRIPNGRKYSASYIPRPRNAFILFRSHAVSSGMIPKELGVKDHKNISKVIGEIWRNLSDEEKKVWDQMAKKEKKEHEENYPGYKFSPKKRKGTYSPVSNSNTRVKSTVKAIRTNVTSHKRSRSGKYSCLPSTIFDADSEDENISEEDELSDLEEEEAIEPHPKKQWKSRPDISQDRIEAIAEAVLQGEDRGIARIVDRKLGIEQTIIKRLVPEFTSSNKSRHPNSPNSRTSTSSSATTFAIAPTPTKRILNSIKPFPPCTPFTHSSSSGSPFSLPQPPSPDHTSLANSTIPPERKHSRFARRSSGSPTSSNFQPARSSKLIKVKPPVTSSNFGSNPFKMNRLPQSQFQSNQFSSENGNILMQIDQSQLMAQLEANLLTTSSPYTLPAPKLPSQTTHLPSQLTYNTRPLVSSSNQVTFPTLEEYFDFSPAGIGSRFENNGTSTLAFTPLDSQTFLGGTGLVKEGEALEENVSEWNFNDHSNSSSFSVDDSLYDTSLLKHQNLETYTGELDLLLPSISSQIPSDFFQLGNSDLFSTPQPEVSKVPTTLADNLIDNLDVRSSSMSWRGRIEGGGIDNSSSTIGASSTWDDTRSELEQYFDSLNECRS